MKKLTQKILFWIAISFIALTVFSLTIGQILPYEFANNKIMHGYYDTIMQGLPIAILLTLVETVGKRNSKKKNLIFAIGTIFTSILSFIIMINLMFQIGFGAWTTVTTIYRNNKENKEIKEQIYDSGALGYKGKRIVEIKPFLKYWILPTATDTSAIDKTEWNLVNEQGDIKFP